MKNDLVGMQEFLHFVESVAELLDEKTVQDARDIEFGQWELPFEAILLSLQKLSPGEVKIDFELVERLAQEADIIECGVLDVDTWSRFLIWKQKQ